MWLQSTDILQWLKVLVARLATMATEDYWQKEAQESTVVRVSYGGESI